MTTKPMSHNHNHSHHHHHGDEKGMKTAFWLNLSFTIFELIGGIVSSSTAIITDAIHDFGDTIAIGSGLWLEKFSKKGRTQTFTYGHRRFSLLSAILLSAFLLTGSAIMLIKGVIDFFSPKVVNDTMMLGMAVVGIIVNGIGFRKIYRENKEKGLNTRAVMLHLGEDVLGRIAVLIGSIVIYFTGRYRVDSLLAVGISLFIISQTIPNLVRSVKIFLQANPDPDLINLITDDILALDGVSKIHDTHLRTLDGENHIMTTHIVINDSVSDPDTIISSVTTIAHNHHINHPTIQIEKANYECELTDC